MLITDIIGIWQNSQLIADQLAANGYYTIVPDLFQGDAIPVNPTGKLDLMGWLHNGSDGKTPHTVEAVDPVVEKAIKYLRQEKGFRKIGAVGYCFVCFLSVPESFRRLIQNRAASMSLASWLREKVSTSATLLILRKYLTLVIFQVSIY